MASNKNPDYEQVKHLLTNTVTLLCKNGVTFSQKLHVEALVGVTVDQNDVFFVHISETIPHNEQSWEKSSSSHGQLSQSDSRYNKMQPQAAKVQRNSVQGRNTPRTQSPVSVSPRSGSPAMVRQPRNGAVLQQQQQQQHHRQFMHQQQMQFQHNQRMQQQQRQQQHSDFVVSKPSPQQPLQTDDEDVVLIKQERLTSPDTVAQQATMVAGRRRVMPTPPPAKVTVIEPVPDPSQDDTQAMQQSYSTSCENLNHTVPSGLGSESEEPPAKRPCVEMGSGSSSTNFIENSPGRHFSGQWAVADSPIPPHPVTYSEPASRSIQAFPGCSTWSSHPTPPQLNASTDAPLIAQNISARGFKNPRNNTMCQPVRDVLEYSLARPVIAEANEISAFRLFWRGHDTIAGWRNIIYNRLELDAIVAEDPGVSFFISAITATARDPKTISPNPTDARLRAYPALGYWIVSRDASFDRHLLMKRLSEAAEGGELKTMLQSDGEKVNEVGALNLIVKDYGKGYVQQRVMESAVLCCNPDEEHPTIRFILKEDHFEEKLREAVDLLSGVGCPVSLEKVDMEALNAEDEEGEEGGNEEDGTGEGENGYGGNEGDRMVEGEAEEQAMQGTDEQSEDDSGGGSQKGHGVKVKKPPPDDDEDEDGEGGLQEKTPPTHTEDEQTDGDNQGAGEPGKEGIQGENVPPDLEGNTKSHGQGDGPGE